MRHLYPLLDFLRFLTYQARGNDRSATPAAAPPSDVPLRLPRRFNGTNSGLSGGAPPAPAPALCTLPPGVGEPGGRPPPPSEAGGASEAEGAGEDDPPSEPVGTPHAAVPDPPVENSGADDDSGSSVSSVEFDPFLLRLRKRMRDEHDAEVKPALKKPKVLNCLVETEFHNGVGHARYVDIPLSEFGGTPLVAAEKLRRAEGQKLLGQSCCYLLSGSSRVAIGTVVDTGPKNVQILPNGQSDIPLRWVDLPDVYKVPADPTAFQEEVTKSYSEVLKKMKPRI